MIDVGLREQRYTTRVVGAQRKRSWIVAFVLGVFAVLSEVPARQLNSGI